MVEEGSKGLRRKAMIKVFLFMGLLVVFVALLTVAKGIFIEEAEVKKEVTGKAVSGERRGAAVGINLGNIAASEMVQSLPKDAVVELKIGESYFSVTKGSVKEGKPAKPDLTISLPAKYVSQVSEGLCELTKSANSNGELVIETHISNTALAWKYKGMLKYKSCLG